MSLLLGYREATHLALRESHTCREAVQQSLLKTKLKCLGAQTYQNKDFVSSLPFLSFPKKQITKAHFF